MAKVTAKEGGRLEDTDARVICKYLEMNFPDGYVDPKKVLELARPKSSPIHEYFNWNDSEAAEKYRLIQARLLIRCLVVEVDGVDTRKYVTPVVIEGIPRNHYIELNLARNTENIWNAILENAMRDAVLWSNRYKRLQELSIIHLAIEETQKQLTKGAKTRRKNAR